MITTRQRHRRCEPSGDPAGAMFAVAVAVMTAVGLAAAGCAAVPLPIPRDLAGPCLQLRLRRVDKSEQATLWRGDSLVANEWSGTHRLETALVETTADHPSAAAEARAWHRSRVAATAVALLVPVALGTFVGVVAVGSHHPSVERAELGVGIGLASISAVAIAAAALLEQVIAPPHLQSALDDFNATPPIGCARSGVAAP